MGILYAFEDAEGNRYLPNGVSISKIAQSTFGQNADSFSWENKIIDKSFLPGSKKLGTTRLKSDNISFSLTRANEESVDFRSALNDLLQAVQKTKYVINLTDETRAEVAPLSAVSTPNKGTEKNFASEEITFERLSPWEDETPNSQDESLTGDSFNDIEINNAGALDAVPVFTFTSSVAIDDIQILIPDNSGSFQLLDPIFGTTGFEELVIDCEQGTAIIGNVDRANFIVAGTGFVQIPPGATQIVRIFVPEDCDVNISWRNRYYV